MNRPSWKVRLNGSPRVAAACCVVYIATLWGWWEGYLQWFFALFAIAAAAQTLSAVKQMRAYNAWVAEWDSLAEDEEEPPPDSRLATARLAERRSASHAGRRNSLRPAGDMKSGMRCVWMLLTWAAAVLAPLPIVMGLLRIQRVSDNLALAWGVACVFLIFRLLAWLLRLAFGRKARRADGAEGKQRDCERGQVALLLERASSSPSRAEAERQLPDYCARLLSRSSNSRRHPHPTGIWKERDSGAISR